MKKLLMIVANRDFQDLEFGNPYQLFQNQGYEIDIASGLGGECF
jgi:putative intracellular protease/amidase